MSPQTVKLTLVATRGVVEAAKTTLVAKAPVRTFRYGLAAVGLQYALLAQLRVALVLSIVINVV